MKISVILAHPYEKSFNHAIANKAIQVLKDNNHDIYFHDLYKEQFNPILTSEELISDHSEDALVNTHSREITEAEGIIFIHPNWWGQPPAIMKGWIDRVFRQGTAYDFPEGDSGGGLPIGLLKVRIGLVFNTSNTPEERENTVFGDPLENIWKACVFGFCDILKFDRRMYRVIADSTDLEREKWLKDVGNLVNRYFPVID